MAATTRAHPLKASVRERAARNELGQDADARPGDQGRHHRVAVVDAQRPDGRTVADFPFLWVKRQASGAFVCPADAAMRAADKLAERQALHRAEADTCFHCSTAVIGLLACSKRGSGLRRRRV
jgi:hypothetical protein